MLSSQFVHVCYVSFNKDQSINQLQYVEDSEPVTRSTLPLVNSAKTELQVQKELDKKRFLTSAPHGRGTTLGSRLFWQPAIRTQGAEVKNLFYPILSALAALFLHCSPMVTLTSLPVLSLQHTELELYYGREEEGKKKTKIRIHHHHVFRSSKQSDSENKVT